MSKHITKPFTSREQEVALVARDLLLKGSPTTRIAKYCLEKGMTSNQIRTFSQKLNLCITDEIMTAVAGFRMVKEFNNYHAGLDHYQRKGDQLQNRLKRESLEKHNC